MKLSNEKEFYNKEYFNKNYIDKPLKLIFEGEIKEIKSCPFCGGEGEIQEERGWSIWVKCQECGAEGAFVDNDYECAENDAIDKWNRRV